MQTDSQLPLFPVFRFKDSEKVLTAIQGHLDALNVEYPTRLGVDPIADASPGEMRARKSTLDFISEVIENASTTQVVPNKAQRAS